jgi:transglutaminase-like putative cysteine protease
MSIHAALTHRTRYSYDRLVGLSPQMIRLRPAPHSRTPVLSYSLNISPKPHFLNWVQDPQGNFIARVVFPERVRHFEVTVDLVADMATINPFDFFVEPQAEKFPFDYDPVLAEELAPFRRLKAPGPLLEAYLKDIPREAPNTVNFLVDLNQRLASEIGYIVRMEPGVWTPEEVLSNRKGSCRDSGWLLVNILRHLGFAARFVSGYLIQLVPDVKPVTGPAGAPGARSMCRAPAGSASIPPPACWRARVTSRSPRRRSRLPPRRSPARWMKRRPSSTSTWKSAASRRRRASPSPTPTPNGARWRRWGRRWTPRSRPATSA